MKKILLLGSGELGKEFVISAKRLGCHVIACDSYAGAPAMQVADEFCVFSMLDEAPLRAAIAKYQPDLIVPEIEAIRTEVLLEVAADGTWAAVTPGVTTPPPGTQRLSGPVLPGLVNAHSHAFQRAFAGLSERRESESDDFWSWRDRMYGVALRISPELVATLVPLCVRRADWPVAQLLPILRDYAQWSAPPLLAALSLIGTAAMLWVGGGILQVLRDGEHLEVTNTRASQNRDAVCERVDQSRAGPRVAGDFHLGRHDGIERPQPVVVGRTRRQGDVDGGALRTLAADLDYRFAPDAAGVLSVTVADLDLAYEVMRGYDALADHRAFSGVHEDHLRLVADAGRGVLRAVLPLPRRQGRGPAVRGHRPALDARRRGGPRVENHTSVTFGAHGGALV